MEKPNTFPFVAGRVHFVLLSHTSIGILHADVDLLFDFTAIDGNHGSHKGCANVEECWVTKGILEKQKKKNQSLLTIYM